MGADTKKGVHEPLGFTFDEVVGTIANVSKPDVSTIAAKPFLKWVGGKRSIMEELEKRLPDTYTRYFEPFIGGGALFFSHQPESAYISDMNFHLILTYRAIKDDVSAVIAELETHQAKHNKTYFLSARKKLNRETDYIKIAGLMIYLNKTCFNGLYRVNKSGEFNVPIGSYTNPQILDEINLRNVSKLLENTEISQHSFAQTPIVTGAFYYLDPPYHETYSNYASDGFGDDKHKQLANFCHKIDKAGGYFMLSNSDTPFVRTLYSNYCIENVAALRSVSCKVKSRGKENECIIRNYR